MYTKINFSSNNLKCANFIVTVIKILYNQRDGYLVKLAKTQKPMYWEMLKLDSNKKLKSREALRDQYQWLKP